MTTPTVDGLLSLVNGIALPDGYARLRRDSPDRLGQLALWWSTVSTAQAPRRVVVGPHDPVPQDTAAGLAHGVALADQLVDDGADLLVLQLPPEVTTGGVPAHVLLAAHLLQLDPVEATDWPGEFGLDDDAWVAQVAALRDARRRIRGVVGEPQRLLSLLDAPWLTVGAGLLARVTARRTPTLLDGAAAAAVGLLVRRAEPAARAWWQAADTGDGLHARVLAELRLRPVLDLGIERGSDLGIERGRERYAAGAYEGLGGRLALATLEGALAVRP